MDAKTEAKVAKEEDKAEEDKVDEKDYIPAFNLLDPNKKGIIPIDAVNELLEKLEGSKKCPSESSAARRQDAAGQSAARQVEGVSEWQARGRIARFHRRDQRRHC